MLPNPGPGSHACKWKAGGSILKTSASVVRMRGRPPFRPVSAGGRAGPRTEHVLPRSAVRAGGVQELRQAPLSFGAARTSLYAIPVERRMMQKEERRQYGRCTE